MNNTATMHPSELKTRWFSGPNFYIAAAKVGFLALLTGCKPGNTTTNSKDDVRERLDVNEISLVPPPGSYTHGVVVSLNKKNNDAGSGLLRIKGEDGTWTSLVYGGPCPGGVKAIFCLNIAETKSITYKLFNSRGESSEKTASYIINHPAKPDIAINNISFRHEHTYCYISDRDDHKLRAKIKVTNESVLGADKVGVIILEFDDLSKIGTALTIRDKGTTGFAIIGANDSIFYSGIDFYPGRNSSDQQKQDVCTVTVSKFIPGDIAEGKISCNLSLDSQTAATAFGKSFVLPETDWSCDSWLD